MATAQTLQAPAGRVRRRFVGYWRLIGPRLLAGFLLVIVLTGAIGVVALQRFSSLTEVTTELSTRDLPEIILIDKLRSPLYRQQDLELNAAPTTQTATLRLTYIADQRSTLLALEPPDPSVAGTAYTALVRTLTTAIAQSRAMALRVQALISSGHVQQALALERSQRAAQLRTLNIAIGATLKLRTLEEQEAAAAAVRAQQETSTATRLVLALTVLSVPLSVLLALLLTRSLTKPLSALLRATEALTSGDLDTSPQVTSRDEIGQLAGAFDAMRSSLRTTIAALALERQQTQAIIDASADGLILVDGQMRVVQINPAAERLTGWRAEEAIGQPCWTVCGCRVDVELAAPCPDFVALSAAESDLPGPAPSGSPNVHGALDHLRTCPGCPRLMMARASQEGISQELLIHLRDGQERWLAVSCAPIPADEATEGRRLVVSLHDISQLKALDQLKTDFVAMVSHELRAPVTTVAGAVEMLSELDPSTDAGAYREVLNILEQQTRRLRAVVDEVLQVTRLEAGRLPVRLQPLDLTGFLRTLLEHVRQEGAGDERPMSVSVSGTGVNSPSGEAVKVWADADMLEIVVRNLLDNARKYTPPGSPLEIDVRPDPAAERVLVQISDHGAGIPPDQIERIFERFSRGTRPASEWTRGYGLGLYIARELMRAHNGDIWAENYTGGARFVFSLCTVSAGEASEPTAVGASI